MSRRYKPLYIEDGSEDDDLQPMTPNSDPTGDPSSLSSPIENEEEDYELDADPKIRHWKNSLYAVGLVEPTWADELYARKKKRESNDDDDEGLVDSMEDTAMICDCACLYLSAVVCSAMGAKRIGNMIILKDRWMEIPVKSYSVSRYEDDEGETLGDEYDDNDECHSHNSDVFVSGNDNNNHDYDNEQEEGLDKEESLHNSKDNPTRKRKVSSKQQQQSSSSLQKRKHTSMKASISTQKRHVLDLVMGPFWPMLLFVTYPLILGISFLTAYFAVFIPGQKWFISLAWTLLTIGLCFALFSVSCRDPGIMIRHHEPGLSSSSSNTPWRWNEETLSYRPRDALYDPECGCIIEEYDHTCPWTGTAIGKKNMLAFQCFISLVCICLVMDILLLTGLANYESTIGKQ